MSIQLDWQIEGDKSRSRQHPEDPKERKARYRGLLRLLLILAGLGALVAGSAYLISQRIRQVDTRLEQLLRDTVEAEVAALRIGDETTFLNLQRSATEDWYNQQKIYYDTIQMQKIAADFNLTGRVDNVVVDGLRARVQVEEIENGVPYLRTWFYWRYDDTVNSEGEVTERGGWRHVPPDYTFWGEAAQLERPRFVVRYQSVDAPFAEGIADQLETWLTSACTLFDCATLPPITLDIVTSPLSGMTWAAADTAWQLVIPSPAIGRVRADQPFDTPQRIEAATVFANRLVDHALQNRQMVYPSDAHYLRSAVVAWLVGRFVQMDTGAYLLESLAKNYGEAKIGQLLAVLQPESDLNVIGSVIGITDLQQMNLDWRDFFTWRLATEDDLIAKRDQTGWQRLVDLRTDADQLLASARFNNLQPPETKIVTALVTGTAYDGALEIRATLRIGDNNLFREDYAVFRVVNNQWVRAS